MWLAAAGAATYAAALVATLPAQAVLPAGTDAAGTIWRGEAAIAGGHAAVWRWSPLASLAAAGFAANWTLDGPGTGLRGQARWSPFAGAGLDDLTGRAGWPLVAALAPRVPFACDFGFDVALDRIRLGTNGRSGFGTVAGQSGACTATVSRTVRRVPRVVLTLNGTDGVVTPWAARSDRLASFAFAGDVLRLSLTAAGAALVPDAAGPSDIEIEL